LMYSGILYFVNNIITGKQIPFFPNYSWVFYLIVIMLSAICNIYSQKYLIIIANEMLVEYEVSILKKVKVISYELFEKLGKQKIYTALGDSWLLSEFPRTFVASANAVIIILCSLGFMFIINVWVATIFTFILVALSLYFGNNSGKIEEEFNNIRLLQDDFYRYMADMLDGYKEIKLNETRGYNLFERFIKSNRIHKKNLSIKTFTKDAIFSFLARYAWYLLIGMIMFLFPVLFKFSLADITICVLIVLHMLDAVNFFVGNFPFYFRVEAALKKLDDLNEHVFDLGLKSKEVEGSDLSTNFEKLNFKDLCYVYKNADNENNFCLGPIDLEIIKGEVLFIEGGNGSGKSTFINLLTGLYLPQSGTICFNDRPIKHDNYKAYMNKFSAVFTNNYLFSENYDCFDISEENNRFSELIDMVEMRKNLKFIEEKNWISSQLSKGQQKRLSLVLALMENREVLILDEWAAEQDPTFRAYFYSQILPKLKATGITLIMVTHDDRYFYTADRIIKFEYGHIVKDYAV
jgi:cyclic peptide transporter